MSMEPILLVTVSVKKIKGATRQKRSKVPPVNVIWCEQTFKVSIVNFGVSVMQHS